MKKLTKKQKLGFIDFYINQMDANLEPNFNSYSGEHYICDSFEDYYLYKLDNPRQAELREEIEEFDLVSDYDKMGEKCVLRRWFRINNEERLFLILFLEQLILDSND